MKRSDLPRGAALALAACLGVAGARAETSGVSTTGFLVTHRHEVKAPPARVLQALGEIDRWWDSGHTYSGRAASLTLDLQAGGCFCERWEGGSVLHAQVVYVDRREHVLRLVGGLGPLQERAVTGVWTFRATAADGRTTVTMTYRVSGPPDAGLERLAPTVDQVLGEAAARLAAYVEAKTP